MTQNQIAYWNLQELQRANRAQEAEKRRANIAQENLAGESNYLKAVDLGEKERHNRRSEVLSASSLEEQVRSNKAKEQDVDQARLQEWAKWGTQRITNERDRLVPSIGDILNFFGKLL